MKGETIMIFNFVYDFSSSSAFGVTLSDEERIKKAKEAAARDLARILVDRCEFQISNLPDEKFVRGWIDTENIK